jgi:hypothetical protein
MTNPRSRYRILQPFGRLGDGTEAQPEVDSRTLDLLGRRPPLREISWANAGLAIILSCAIAGVPVCALPADVERTGTSEQNDNRR